MKQILSHKEIVAYEARARIAKQAIFDEIYTAEKLSIENSAILSKTFDDHVVREKMTKAKELLVELKTCLADAAQRAKADHARAFFELEKSAKKENETKK